MASKKTSSSNTRRAVFLDRDGTLNYDPGYLKAPNDLHLYPDVPLALKQLKKAGFELIVISNQSGIARGLIPAQNVPKIHQKLNTLLKETAQVQIDLFLICPHHPQEHCLCRKPKPGLLLQAKNLLPIDLKKSYLIGDRQKDLQAGQAAGLYANILVLTGEGKKEQHNLRDQEADFLAHSFQEACQWILKKDS